MRRTLLLEPIHDASFETFQSDGLKFQNFGNMVGRNKGIFVSKADECSILRAVNQPHFCFEDHRAGSLGPDKRSRHIESSFWK